MSSTVKKLTMMCALITGTALWGGYAQHFNSKGELEYEPNVACLKGSPYGKVLALAMQGSIDFYWHKGSSHEHAEVLNAEHHHDSGDHGDHDHGGQSHRHAENIVTNDGVSGCSGCAGCDAKKKTAQAAHVDSENKKDISERVSENNDPLRERAKKLIKKMSATAHRRTDEKPLTAAHKKYILGVTEDKLRLAYDLDPSNYTNYGNLHLFISTTTYGRDPANDAAAVKLARKTLDFCKKDQIDPASWVTAASAAYNIIYHIGRYHEHFTIAEAKSSLSEFDSCIARYNELLELAVSEGRIVSELRYQEMSERVRYMSKLRESQGVYMKRVMSTKMAVNHQSSSNK